MTAGQHIIQLNDLSSQLATKQLFHSNNEECDLKFRSQGLGCLVVYLVQTCHSLCNETLKPQLLFSVSEGTYVNFDPSISAL